MRRFVATALLSTLTTFLVLFSGCDGDDSVNAPPPSGPDTAVATVSVDFSEEHQIIRGFGGATVFRLNQALSEQDMDRIFGTGEGELGFSLHRIRVVPDENEWARDVELEHARGAKERGANVIASPWSPPARMKTNNDLVGGSLERDSFAVYAEYLNNFAEYMANHEAELYAISIQNEPDIEVDYESCDWTSSEMTTFLREQGSKITETRVIAPESYNFDHSFSDPILNDSDAASNVDIIGGHIYGGGLEPYPEARDMGKEVWMTEHLDTTTTWQANLATGKEIHDSMVDASFSAYFWWYVKRFYGPLNENGEISKRGYIMGQFSKSVRPGYHRVNVSDDAPSDDVYVSAYTGENAVLIALNMGTEPVTLDATLENRSVSELVSYRTTETENLSQGSTSGVSNGSYSYTLPPESVTTFVEE